MHLEPLVSVIMPAYNAERYIGEAVQSVIKQTWKNWELIVVNDGSTDGTRKYLESLIDSRIRVIHQKNKGVSAARNRALEVTRGEFITFLDADDALPVSSLAARAQHLQNHGAVDIVDGIISTRDATLEKEMRSYHPCYHGPLLPRLLKLDERVFFGPFYMVRNSRINSIRFREDMTHVEDFHFYLVLADKFCLEYSYVSTLIYIYRKSEGTAMSNMDGLEKGYLQLVKSIKSLRNVSWLDFTILKLKISKILLLSWFAKRDFNRGIKAGLKAWNE